ncbi:metallophosphoesterase [Aureivirga sp. CE67]|uniref:metallophosphoesterase n=1 Tax=Aureivirga sp. CE67 TaxID=1788983 RepID=UPI0018C90AB7|nr:metallophosphoesterase [Aureivirga sp. CE67]
MFKFIAFCFAIFLIDYYGYQFIKTTFDNRWTKITYVLSSVIILGLTFYTYTFGRQNLSIPTSNIFTGIFVLVYVTKLTFALVFFIDDIFRIFKAVFNFFTNNSDEKSFHIPSRRKFTKQLALGLAAIPFSSLLYGIIKGKYNFKVLNYTLYFEDLPEAFDGYQLTQISDIHSGSFDNKEKIEYAIDLINQQKSDAILFTGDMVNLSADEMLPWKSTFKKLQAKDGIFSVLGNHDYGDYVKWNSPQEKVQNLENLKQIQKEMGFQLLLNENRFIERNDQRIAMVGVENWGNGFIQKGDLNKASENIAASDFKILLSHDPTHWQEKVISDSNHYHLTLSGHTHGMQMGIEIPGFIKWSPIKWRYKYWAGIYKEKGQYLNVNRGFGFLAYPGRVGVWPEITVINLKKGSKPS